MALMQTLELYDEAAPPRAVINAESQCVRGSTGWQKGPAENNSKFSLLLHVHNLT
jgi:hypothetical protein